MKIKKIPLEFKLRISKDYPWKVLSHLSDDLSRAFGIVAPTELQKSIRYRNAADYLRWSADNGLQSIAHYDCSYAEALVTNQRSALLKKFPLSVPGIDRSSEAIKKFLATEEKIRSFNKDLPKIYTENIECVTFIRNFISKVLGDAGTQFKNLFWDAKFGPGVSLGVSKGQTSNFSKFSSIPYTCTDKAAPIALGLISEDNRWHWTTMQYLHTAIKSDRLSDCLKVINFNKVTTVPKTALIDRTIAIEPLMNVMLQLGIHSYLQKRLKRFCNIDLTDQTRNQTFCKDYSLATIDLSAASDSISNALIGMLFPPVWCQILRSLRSPFGLLPDGSRIKYAKISSMGNGFTFGLECLLFSAIVASVVGVETLHKRCAVYGDDIIVPTEHFSAVSDRLSLFGFSLNLDKSFSDGPIRESCGVEFFNGLNFRPVFLKNFPTNVTHLYNDFNRIQRFLWLHVGKGSYTSLDYIHSLIPKGLRFYGPILEDKYLSYDTYLHSADKGHYPTKGKNMFTYTYKSVVSKTPGTSKASREAYNFGFRSLSHDLKVCDSEDGSRFVDCRRHSTSHAIKVNRSVIWNEMYEE